MLRSEGLLEWLGIFCISRRKLKGLLLFYQEGLPISQSTSFADAMILDSPSWYALKFYEFDLSFYEDTIDFTEILKSMYLN